MQWNPWMVTLVRAMSRTHSALYRVLGGAGFMNRNTLILTTRGRKSGRDTPGIPLLYVEDGGRLYIVGSFGGSDAPPGWYRNLVVHPEVTAEVSSQRGGYRTRTLTPDEAKPIWPRLLAIWPQYADYQKKTTRVIPVIELTPLAA
jgi:deazaflavin-dependent oxidoreductase (nitroreductase family)